MDQYKETLAQSIRKARLAKNYTQAELADKAGLSLRSVQRIESGDVIARAFTLRSLAAVLDVELPLPIVLEEPVTTAGDDSKRRRVAPLRSVFMAILLGFCIFLFAVAFLSQSSSFPETSFELFIFWALVCSGYLVLLAKLWYGRRRASWRL